MCGFILSGNKNVASRAPGCIIVEHIQGKQDMPQMKGLTTEFVIIDCQIAADM